MSRNLCTIACACCWGGHESIVLEEARRPITEREAHPCYYPEYRSWLLVANASCLRCGAKYLAWITDRDGYSAVAEDGDERRVLDLSFRSTFNDEPGPDDLPPPEKLRETHERECQARIKDLEKQIDALRAEIVEEQDRMVTGSPHWESYRRLR